MEVAKLNLGGMNQQILYHKSDFMHFFEINVESLHLVPNTCLVSVQILDPHCSYIGHFYCSSI